MHVRPWRWDVMCYGAAPCVLKSTFGEHPDIDPIHYQINNRRLTPIEIHRIGLKAIEWLQVVGGGQIDEHCQQQQLPGMKFFSPQTHPMHELHIPREHSRLL